MKRSSLQIVGVPRLVIVGLLGGFIGLFIAGLWNPLPLGPRNRIVPAAYRIPKIPGGTPLRLEMVHDILHERYLRQGENLRGRECLILRLPTPFILPVMTTRLG